LSSGDAAFATGIWAKLAFVAFGDWRQATRRQKMDLAHHEAEHR